MSNDQRPTPETDAAIREIPESGHYSALILRVVSAHIARKLERERDEAREELLKQRIENNHNWQAVADLEEMIKLARELRDALHPTLTSLIGRMVIKDTDTVERAHAALTKAKEVLL